LAENTSTAGERREIISPCMHLRPRLESAFMIKAGIVTIGNEVLSGRIMDRVDGELKTAGLLKISVFTQ